MFEKKIVDGKVAVLYSPGFGAGWSTWADGDKLREFMVFDSVLVDLCLAGGTDAQAHERIKTAFGDDGLYVYTGGWLDTCVEWLDQGCEFLISEYDGSESIKTRASHSWHRA